jgi:hypothetical protein
MTDAEIDLSLIIGDMAANFFPWKSPTTNLQKSLLWIQVVVSTIVSFIPVIGPLVSLGPRVTGPITSAAQAFTIAGFQELLKVGGDPILVYNLLVLFLFTLYGTLLRYSI